MDPNVQEADNKRDQATEIESTATDLRNQGNNDEAASLETTATDLRQKADQEASDAQMQADQEKAEVDRKYGTG